MAQSPWGIETGPVRPISALDVRQTRAPGGSKIPAALPGQAATPAPAMVASDVLEAGTPPVDAERVQIIRKAIEDGSYPVIPTRIADAVIAAGMLWRTPS